LRCFDQEDPGINPGTGWERLARSFTAQIHYLTLGNALPLLATFYDHPIKFDQLATFNDHLIKFDDLRSSLDMSQKLVSRPKKKNNNNKKEMKNLTKAITRPALVYDERVTRRKW